MRIYSDFSYKYRLLYCLLLNYYRKYYTSQTGKILVICNNKKEALSQYDKMNDTIKAFKASHINTLRKFTTKRDKQLETLFKYLDKTGLSYKDLIKKLKKEYISSKMSYLKFKYVAVKKKLPSNQNIMFVELEEANLVYDTHLIKEIFIPEYFSSNNVTSNELNKLCFAVRPFILGNIKEKEVLEANSIDRTIFSALSIFIESNDGLEIEDSLNNLVNKYIDD